MSVCFGIYLGNSACCVAVYKDGKTEVVANAAGDRVTPAVVAFHESEVVTGVAAKQGLIRYGNSTIQGALHVIGNSPENKGVTPLGAQCIPNWENNQPIYSIQCGSKNLRITPEKVLQHIFSQLKEIAGSHCTNGELPVVVALPAWAEDSTVAAVRSSSRSAGFRVLSTVIQPAAACLAYGLVDNNKENLSVVVLHCGGSTVVGSLVEIAGGLLIIRESTVTSYVAGDGLTEDLVKYLAKEFYMKYKGDPLENRRSKRKLFNAAENCKHVLSTVTTSKVYVESLWEGVDFSLDVSRGRFENQVSSTLSAHLQPTKELIEKFGYALDQIDKVVLSGGSCKIPKLQQMVSDSFPKAEILYSVPSDEVLAVGAAAEAALILENSGKKYTPTSSLIPSLATAIYCKISDSKISECVFGRGTPTHSRQSLSLPLDCASSTCSLLLYEANQSTSSPTDDQILAQVDLSSLVADSCKLNLNFHLKSDGSLVVGVAEPVSKISHSFIIETCKS